MKTFQRNLLVFSVGIAAAGLGSQALAVTTTMMSVTPQKIVGNNVSSNISLSKSGTQCAFESDATNFSLQDGNANSDIFMKVGAKITRVSVNSLGQEATNSAVAWYNSTDEAGSYNAAISSDGKLVAFQSNADNLDMLTQDTNNSTGSGTESDIFVRDIAKKKTYRLSGILNSIDGPTTGLLDAFGNPVSATDAPWKVMTEADDWSGNPAIAGTAKQAWVAFESYATTLSPYATSGNDHIYAVDLKTKKIELIDAPRDISGNPTAEGDDNSSNVAISADGRFVVYQSDATNLVAGGLSGGVSNIFIYDRKRLKTYQISGVLSSTVTNGYVVSGAADNNSAAPSIAGDGKSKTKSYMIAFESRATNMDINPVPGSDNGTDRDVFVVEFAAIDPKDVNSDYEIKSQRRISAPLDAVTGLPTGEAMRNGSGTGSNSRAPVIAGTNLAYKVAFTSTADNLIAQDPINQYWNEDSNGAQDIYVFDSKTNTFSRANVDPTGQQGTLTANSPAISGDAKTVGFDTLDDFLTPISLSAGTQVYIHK